ncbi:MULTISPECIES: flagellar motor protein MotB [Dehalobacter]|jgi:chemotaxis protein MotB|uniref:Chemotaxis protein MotB n=1 Tax=Dehalobacter restrictus (strain DSM 9455 / PER-K23) TaxID=871738 RepID=A0ABN4BR76_DEHRP|nr:MULTISPECIES: flagellar motor protein MotB [Dehalobacter]AHF09958.1 chemotaxis protein MotB [Dehalobacter restrictus DSM 9455]MCG1026251.1 flagellar motor protein MotB [Dehalobacter sp.]MDJ0306598.1 flagellar motor protein MotB [Dehalobacter sp.]OCZ53298.1 chemotaxis protein MotB [Dehalobacter sp. TeCB1]
MSKKKQHHEEHVDESWLLPYSDLLTLLLALFIVMFAISQVDKVKLQQLSESFKEIFAGGASFLEKESDQVVELEPSSSENDSASALEQDKMADIKKQLEKEIYESGYYNNVKVNLDKEGLQIVIQDVMLFASGDAEILDAFSPLLLQIGKMLNDMDNDIKVVGHTDDRPIHTEKFRSNWELSAIRAINVMNFLVDQGGMNPERFSVQGYGQYSPISDNTIEEGRAENRRVEIFLLRKYPVAE